jgi:endonuclease/exonuclease/phosphatase family metal-dependent hydrolase
MSRDDIELSRAIERARHLRIAYEHVREDPSADSTHLEALRDEIAAADTDIARLQEPDKENGSS